MRLHALVRLRALAASAVIVMLAASAACMSTPASQTSSTPPVIGADEQAATLAAMKPPKRQRPAIAILGQNDGAETTDYLVPYGVLKQSGLAEVWAVATQAGPLTLHPALKIQPQATTADFDARYPDGADYVIVPALHYDDDPAVLAWVKAQAAKGATIIGVCSGVKVLSNAGLLRDRAATGHWYDIEGLQKDNPTMRWVRDRRYVADRGVVTTTGVTASVPVSLALVEAIGGHASAAALARALGVESWDPRHDSSAYRLGPHLWTVVGNTLAFWNRERVGIPVADGVDEIALAFTADAYSRTYRARAVTIADGPGALKTRRGLQLIPDAAKGKRTDITLPPPAAERPVGALDAALDDIVKRYGERSAALVAVQLEYPRLQVAPGTK